MKKVAYVFAIFICICALTGLGTSCNKNVFDIDVYDTLAKIKSPVDTVDPNHTWILSEKKTLKVNVNAGVGAKMLQILTDDPVVTTEATILAQKSVHDGDQFSINISYPQRLNTLYAALIDANGRYTISSFRPAFSNRVDFSNSIYQSQSLSYTPLPHYYAFCYEQEFPEFGDYDYNDVVMHIALDHSVEKTIKFHVRLAAVGADEPLAGAIRLPSIKMEDIDSVYTENDKSFNVNMHGEEIAKQNMSVHTYRDLLLESKKGEPVLNLFADAHWAMGDIRTNEYGVYSRKQYNVAYGTTTTTTELMPREITFAIKVKDDLVLNYLTLDDIDPFIIRMYANNRREIHTFPYRTVDALYENKYVDIQNLPWALVIPTGDFCHPLHGQNIGFRMKTDYNDYAEILFGAYSYEGHSFGEWSVDRTKATDWYLKEYGTKSQIFMW